MEFTKHYKFKLRTAVIAIILAAAIVILFTRGAKTLETVRESHEVARAAAFESIPKHPVADEFSEFMENELDSSQTVGAAFTLVIGDQVVQTVTYGEIKKGSGIMVDPHTVFRLASVSKGFAGALACLLEDEGVFSLDDRVVDRYPGFRLKDSVNTADLTLRHILSHTSGLVPYAFDNLVEAGEDLSSIVDRLSEVEISAPPGELYGYQNVLFSMIDPISRRATGVPYQVLLEERIFRPLGMDDASAGPVNTAREKNFAYPHVRGMEGYISLEPHEGYYNVMPAAGVNASITDMGNWLLALLGNKPGGLPDSVCVTLVTPVVYTPLKARYTRYWKPFRERYYSLGWRVYRYRDREIVYHGGYIRGYRAEIGFCPEEKVGIAFLQNSPNGLASMCVPGFFDHYFDYTDLAPSEVNE